MTAEEISDPYLIDDESKLAIDMEGDFRWETAYKKIDGPKFDLSKGKGKGKGKDDKAKPPAAKKSEKTGAVSENVPAKRGWFKKKSPAPTLPTTQDSKDQEVESAAPSKRGSMIKEPVDAADDKPFDLMNVKFKVPRGSFVAIVGRVGSGKVSG